MTKRVLVVAPHPDDETLGCGGTLLALKNKGYTINWLIITGISEEKGYSSEIVDKRLDEIEIVADLYGFDNVISLEIPTTEVDQIGKNILIDKISQAFNNIKPNILLVPNMNDVHTDHKEIALAVLSCTKWFRYPYVEKTLFYETLSETNFNINTKDKAFRPNVYIDISDFLEKKIRIMKVYKSEMGDFPFPRSEKAIRSLAYLRGSESGTHGAEAFELLRANIKL